MEIFIIIGLILLNGLLSMSEIALVSARKARLELEAKRGNKSAKTALKLANEPDRFLSTIQIGITLIGILTGLYSGEAFAYDLAEHVRRIPFLEPYALGFPNHYCRDRHLSDVIMASWSPNVSVWAMLSVCRCSLPNR